MARKEAPPRVAYTLTLRHRTLTAIASAFGFLSEDVVLQIRRGEVTVKAVNDSHVAMGTFRSASETIRLTPSSPHVVRLIVNTKSHSYGPEDGDNVDLSFHYPHAAKDRVVMRGFRDVVTWVQKDADLLPDVKIPNAIRTVVVDVRARELRRAVDRIRKDDSYTVVLRSLGDRFGVFTGAWEADTPGRCVPLFPKPETHVGEGVAAYTAEILADMVGAIPSMANVKLELGTETPLRMSWSTSDGEFTYLLAPIVDDADPGMTAEERLSFYPGSIPDHWPTPSASVDADEPTGALTTNWG